VAKVLKLTSVISISQWIA